MAHHPSQDDGWLLKSSDLPLAFAQTREDSLLDRWVVDQVGSNPRIAMIASGGCTAAHLAANHRVESIDLVDANPAQLALTRLKIHLLEHFASRERLELLGHQGTLDNRQNWLPILFSRLGLDQDVFGPFEWVCQLGPDYAGRYEAVFQRLSFRLKTERPEWQAILSASTPWPNASLTEEGSLVGRFLDEVMGEVLSLDNLVALFGEAATQNPVEPFSCHFAGRVRHTLSTHPPLTNPFLWQMLACRYPASTPVPWLELPMVKNLPLLRYHQGFMADFLASVKPGSLDFVHLSNILDWLTPEEARNTLEVSARALRPGGAVFIRQLNSSLDITGLCPAFRWRKDEGSRLLARDRSFFYRALHLGTKHAGD